MNYKDTPEYEGQHRVLKPEGKRLLGRVAAILLAITFIGGGIAASKNKEVKNYFDNNIFYSSVDNNIDGPDLAANGIGRPDILPVPMNAKITDEELDGKILELEDGARLRTSPVFGEDGDKTTLATLEQIVLAYDIDNYKLCVIGNGDVFIGISTTDAKRLFPNVKFEDCNDDIWVNAGEVDIIGNPEN